MNSKVSSPVNAGGLGGATITISSTSSWGTSLTVPSSAYLTSTGSTASWSNGSGNITIGSQPSLSVSGDADIAGTLKIGGRDIAKSLEAIERRLAILVPDPDKLEHFEALKKAYDHYKTLEALCQLPKKEEE